MTAIYNSRNYSILLNIPDTAEYALSTTVEIILYYLTMQEPMVQAISTTVEIILYYLTPSRATVERRSTTVEIILYYLTKCTMAFSQHNLQQ